ncbi:amidohydrolase family protein [Paenibacillus doosanensis]|nr:MULTISPECIES: amidohydrolase family protein [Paenibacillus]MCS7462740.1 amidohydrolase family protein [Paenibacillus doosanensis]
MDSEYRTMDRGMMVVERGAIVYIGDHAEELLAGADEIVDLAGKWVLPGLVNTHSHIVMTILRGVGDDMLLKPWLETRIWPMESRFTTEIAAASARLGILEMLKSGTTTFSDMFNPAGIDADAVMQAVAETGIRGAFSYTIFSMGTLREQQANLAGAERFARRYKTAADGRLTTMVAPHSPYACTPHALVESVRIAHENDLMLHIHVSETETEVSDIERRYGVRPVEHLRRLGLFGRPAVMAHGVVLNDEERQIMKRHDVRVAHNPISNLKLGSGIADVGRLLDAGIKVGIATDGVASNNNFDMFEEMRTAALLQKGTAKDAGRLPAPTVYAMATRMGAEAIGMSHTGSLERGKRADFITIDPYDKPHLQPVSRASSHLLYSVCGRDVCDVYIDGNVVVKNGQCLTMDEEKVMAEANRLLSRIGEPRHGAPAAGR